MIKKTVDFWSRHQGLILQFILALIFLLFIAILISVAIISKQANPILLDEHGKPVSTH